MNCTLKLTELNNPFYIYYYENNKPKLLKKNTEQQMLSSVSKLKDKELAYFAINLETFEIFTSDYKEVDSVNENYLLIVKTKDDVMFFTVGPRPFYDEPVYLSMGDFVMINRKEQEYVKHIR